MNKLFSVFWVFALLASLLVLAAAYYVRVAGFRQYVDAHTPLAHKYLSGLVKGGGAELPPPIDPSSNGPAPEGPITVPPITPIVYDLPTIAADRSVWPKKVALKKATNFPAVQNGRVVGSIVVPAGSEANLRDIKDGKVGLEYQGGGAWLPADQTDLVPRVQAAHGGSGI